MRPIPLKVLIVDDHQLMAAAVQRLLSEWDDIEVVGRAASGGEVLPLARRMQPHVVLLDVGLPDVDGLECARRIRKELPDVRVLMLTAYGDFETVEAAESAGAHGYVLKSVAAVDLAAAIRGSEGTGGFLLVGFPDPDRTVELTERETEVLRGLCDGLTNRQIGRRLWITDQTVKFHLKNVFRKLGAADRAQAVQRAHERGLVWSGERRTAVPS